MTITVNRNLNIPTFDQLLYNITVIETEPVGLRDILTVTARDGDRIVSKTSPRHPDHSVMNKFSFKCSH